MCLGCCSIGRVNGSSSTTRFTQTRDENRAALLSDRTRRGSLIAVGIVGSRAATFQTGKRCLMFHPVPAREFVYTAT